MRLIQCVIAVSNVKQPIISAALVPDRILPFQQFIPQNNGSNNMRMGDVTVSTTKGIILSPTGSLSVAPALQYSGDLSEFYVVGTSGDVLDIMILD